MKCPEIALKGRVAFSLLTLAFFIVAVVTLAHVKAEPQRGGTRSDLLTLPDRNEFGAKLGYMKWSIWEYVAVSSPTPKIEVYLTVYGGLHKHVGNGTKVLPSVSLWPNHCVPVHFRHTSNPQVRKFKVIRQRIFHRLIVDVHAHVFGRSSARVLHRKIKIGLIITNRSSCDSSEEHKGALYVNESGFGRLVRILGFNGAIARGGSRYHALIGSSFHLAPLQAGIVGVLNQENQSSGGQEESSPLKQREGEELEFVAFLLFVVGLWFIYTAFEVEQKTIIRIFKIFFGIAIVIFGTLVEQAALNLIDFGHVCWERLF